MLAAQIDSVHGRQQTLQLFINLTRWVRSVHDLHLLPPAPGLEMYTEHQRVNPYSEGKLQLPCHGSLQRSCGPFMLGERWHITQPFIP